eukprot:1152225-Pelagomonas_calceolata.AAC.7
MPSSHALSSWCHFRLTGSPVPGLWFSLMSSSHALISCPLANQYQGREGRGKGRVWLWRTIHRRGTWPVRAKFSTFRLCCKYPTDP